MQLTHDQILDLLPHRYPFLLVDGVTDYELGKFMTGHKMVSFNEPFFQGHFPGNPIMPGVLIVEALAQLSCILISLEYGEKANDMTPLFLGIDKAKFRAKVTPGVRLDLRIDVHSHRRGIAKMTGTAKIGDELASEADITCMMR